MAPGSKYAFYGTLRQGMVNFMPFRDSLEYLRTVKIPGFRMYSRGPYPYVVRSNDQHEVITAELIQITNRAAEIGINALELEAGYFLDFVFVENEKFGIYVFQQNFMDDLHISSGDWAQYMRERRF